MGCYQAWWVWFWPKTQNFWVFLCWTEDLCRLFHRVSVNYTKHHCVREKTMISIGDQKNKKRIVPSPDVTKSDFTIGFSVVDLVKNEVWLVHFLLECRDFSEVGIWKVGCLFINSASSWLVQSYQNFFYLKDQPKILTSIENRTVVTSSWPEMTSSKKSSIFQESSWFS